MANRQRGFSLSATHVDVSDPTLTALKAMLEVGKQEVAPWVDLQIVAFPGRDLILPQW